jgi:hypothetical protein
MRAMLRILISLCLLAGPACLFLSEAQAESTETAVSVKRVSRGWSGSRSFGAPRFSLVEDEVQAPLEGSAISPSHSRARMTRDPELYDLGCLPQESDQCESKPVELGPLEEWH